jgi:hypothetical protein
VANRVSGEGGYDLATAHIAVVHGAIGSAEAAFEAARARVPEYVALGAAERSLARADLAD